MPEFYDFEVIEPTYSEPESAFEVFEEESTNDFQEESEQIDVEEEPEKLEVEEKVPGSDAKFVQFVEDKPKEGKKEKDWEHDKDPTKFIIYIKDRLSKIPRHSGLTIAGNERAISYLKNLENEASKAMRSDFEGKIDEGELDKIRKDIDDMVFRLENQIERLQKKSNDQRVRFISQGECKVCNSVAPIWHNPNTDEIVCMNCEKTGGLSKTAGTAVVNVFVTPFERAIVGTAINATVSGGKNIEEVFDHLDKKYKFNDREKLAFVQLLADSGYPLRIDRAKVGDKEGSEGESEWITNYHA